VLDPVAQTEPSDFITNEEFVCEPTNNELIFVTFGTDIKLVVREKISVSFIMLIELFPPAPYKLLSLVIT
jgi:hypothetical protein